MHEEKIEEKFSVDIDGMGVLSIIAKGKKWFNIRIWDWGGYLMNIIFKLKLNVVGFGWCNEYQSTFNREICS